MSFVTLTLRLLLETVACCVDSDIPGSCRPLVDVRDASDCQPMTEWALCQVEGARLQSCEAIELFCCAETSGVVWVDVCEEYTPGTKCGGAVAVR